MNILFWVIGAACVFFVAYWVYGTFLSGRIFNIDDTRPTPSVRFSDGVDYVPTDSKFLSGQHFSAIAGAGPITGPIVAGIMFGWAPALIWIILGSILIGGVHDMGAIIASVRHNARSITEVVRRNVSRRAWLLFLMFTWLSLVYVIVAFTDITSGSFVGTITLDNGQQVDGGGIATSSLLYLALPVFMGILLKKTRLSLTWATVIFLPLVGLSIWVGPSIPLQLDAMLGIPAMDAQKVWNGFLLLYCFVVSLLPMWMLLQPRGHLGGYFLYASLLAAAVGLIFGGFEISYPAFTLWDRSSGDFWFPMFPVLFITVACGACSGFHALVGSGTTSKQLRKESDARYVGYGMMLMEGMLAVVALASVMILSKDSALVKSSPNFIFASGIGRFVDLVGIPAAFGISFGLMAFTTFVYDTLDICTRLGRYILEELTGWEHLAGKIFASAVTIGVPFFFLTVRLYDVDGNQVSAWKVFWSIFGASNQLLAAMTLLGITVWLYKSARNKLAWLFTMVPAVWMFVMSNWALLKLMGDHWFPGGRMELSAEPVPLVALVLTLLSLSLAVEIFHVIVIKWRRYVRLTIEKRRRDHLTEQTQYNRETEV